MNYIECEDVEVTKVHQYKWLTIKKVDFLRDHTIDKYMPEYEYPK